MQSWREENNLKRNAVMFNNSSEAVSVTGTKIYQNYQQQQEKKPVHKPVETTTATSTTVVVLGLLLPTYPWIFYLSFIHFLNFPEIVS